MIRKAQDKPGAGKKSAPTPARGVAPAKPAPPKAGAPSKPAPAPRRMLWPHVVAAVLLIAGAAWGYAALRKAVEHKYLFAESAPTLALSDRPAWMSDYLEGRIIESARPRAARSPLDAQALEDVYRLLQANPWVKRVKQVRRVYNNAPGDLIEADCEYHEPIALVSWGGYFWLVDREGAKLPEVFTVEQLPQVMFGRDGSRRTVNLRVIEGVTAAPPDVGKPWAGEDLRAGIDLCALLYDKPVAEEIWRVDVTNTGYRKDPQSAQLVVVTRQGSRIGWGEPVGSKYHVELSPARKLQRLGDLKAKFGSIDSGQTYIDIRFPDVTAPAQ